MKDHVEIGHSTSWPHQTRVSPRSPQRAVRWETRPGNEVETIEWYWAEKSPCQLCCLEFVTLRGKKKKFKPRPHSIFVSLKGSFQNLRLALSSYYMEVPPGIRFCFVSDSWFSSSVIRNSLEITSVEELFFPLFFLKTQAKLSRKTAKGRSVSGYVEHRNGRSMKTRCRVENIRKRIVVAFYTNVGYSGPHKMPGGRGYSHIWAI